jgi:hypothetical protein
MWLCAGKWQRHSGHVGRVMWLRQLGIQGLAYLRTIVDAYTGTHAHNEIGRDMKVKGTGLTLDKRRVRTR